MTQAEFVVVDIVDMSWNARDGHTGRLPFKAFAPVPEGGCGACAWVHPTECEICRKPATFTPCEGSWCDRHDPFGKPTE